ncbi:MAG: hypothetical protein H0W50_09035 [Parachlamydiaceae bacterium]|nr:hypothetical protein [Parachlamydiaceae bacterium]
MPHSHEDAFQNTKLQVSFPKSSQDHRLQLVGINGSIFAILHSPLESNGPINLNCEDWSLVLLAPIKSKSDVEITAINVICLNEVKSEEGTVNIKASNRLVNLAPSIMQTDNVHLTDEFQLADDPATFMYHFQLFNKIVSGAKVESPDAFSITQQNFIMSLCSLANKIEGKTTTLNIRKVLEIWNIAVLD